MSAPFTRELTRAAPPVRRSSADDAALYIRRLIFDGALRAGDRVPQDEVANALGISRIPIREALISLERDGWVTVELHRGAFVNQIDEQTILDHYELYGVVYSFALEQALVRTPGVGDQLVDLASSLVKELDPVRFGELAVAFHRAVIDASKSQRVKVVARSLSALVPGEFFVLVPGALQVERKSVPLIARAMQRGDAEKAASEYRSMAHKLGLRVRDAFAAHGLFAAAPSDPG